jgi:hypothetical protein
MAKKTAPSATPIAEQATPGLSRAQLDKALARQDKARAKVRKAAGMTSRGISRGATSLDELTALGGSADAGAKKFYPDFDKGRFAGEPRLVWVKPDRFRHELNTEKPFSFIRKNGEAIAPGEMITDGGSIPRLLWSIKDLSPWAYGPAFLIHDWLFVQHHSGATDKPFEEVRDILMEAIRTLMEDGPCEFSRVAFDAIYAGVDSPVARALWDGKG